MTLLDDGRWNIIMARVLPSWSLEDETTAPQSSPHFHAMKFRFHIGLAALVCLSLASCYPYDESKGKKKVTKAPDKTQTVTEDAKKKEADLKLKAEQEALKKKEEVTAEQTVTPDAGTVTPPKEEPKEEPKRQDWAFANKVPGKEGFVFSPYNNKVVDVRDIPSGTLVQDPTYPASEKKYFRVP